MLNRVKSNTYTVQKNPRRRVENYTKEDKIDRYMCLGIHPSEVIYTFHKHLNLEKVLISRILHRMAFDTNCPLYGVLRTFYS